MAEKHEIVIERTSSSRLAQIDFANLTFGAEFSDHMFVVDYIDGQWVNPKITPFQNLSVSPSMTALHYGQTIFEGLKAFKNTEGEISVFRPLEHAKRLNTSAERLCMATLPEELFMDGLKTLLKVDKDWVPSEEGCSLYIRPMMIATDVALGVSPAKSYKFIIFTSPVASYYAGSVKVLAETEYTRAAEGGTGFIKAGGNYAASLLPAKNALDKGYDQVLWTDGKEHKYVEECGTMNVMFQIGDTLITPATGTSVLSGITRKSIIALAQHWGYKIEERKLSLEELKEASANDELKDAFGTGTAATITHISHIGIGDTVLELPAENEREFSNKAQDYLTRLKAGQAEDFMGWMEKM